MTLLLLAGTKEARELSLKVPQDRLISSLAGATQRPATLGGRTRVGGFGGVEGLSRFLKASGISGVIDATHPFAAQMSMNAFLACRQSDVPLLQVMRPPWDTKPEWRLVPDLDGAATVLRRGAHVFLATGRASLSHFEKRSDVRFTARVIDDLPGAFPLENGAFLVSKPPFSVEEEVETLKSLGVEVLVVRNSGGEGGIEKLKAADSLGIEVVMVERPALLDVARVTSVAQALDYLKGNGWLDAS